MRYYLGKIQFETIDDNNGRVKKTKEQYLVEAQTISDAEAKLNEMFKDTMAEFTVISVSESPIMGIVK
jgi:hypothetical protein